MIWCNHVPLSLLHLFPESLNHSWPLHSPLQPSLAEPSLQHTTVLQCSLLDSKSCRHSLLTQALFLAAPWGTDLGQPLGASPLGSSCGIPQHALPNTNTPTCAFSHSPRMWCLLVLLCSQGIAFSAGITAPSTLNSDKSQYKKTPNPECFMNVVSWVTFSPFLSKASLQVPLPLPHH